MNTLQQAIQAKNDSIEIELSRDHLNSILEELKSLHHSINEIKFSVTHLSKDIAINNWLSVQEYALVRKDLDWHFVNPYVCTYDAVQVAAFSIERGITAEMIRQALIEQLNS